MCWKCGNNILIEENVSRSQVCPVCKADLHSCRNCVFYSPGSHYDCHESVDEAVSDKERANFCDNFKLKKEWDKNSLQKGQDKAEQARQAFKALFS